MSDRDAAWGMELLRAHARQAHGFRLYEPCAGSAALTLYLMGASEQLLPYQGNKWRLAPQIAQVLAMRGFADLGAACLADPGPWGAVWSVIGQGPAERQRLVVMIREFVQLDPRETYDRIVQEPCPEEPVELAARFLFLQRLSPAGRAVGWTDAPRRWRTAGFNKSSAYGTRATRGFGGVRPMLPYLVECLERMDSLRWPARFSASSESFEHPGRPPATWDPEQTVIFIDPPYLGTTGYLGDAVLSRDAVVRNARIWHKWGALVVISEAEPIAPLVDAGWETRQLKVAEKTGHAGWSQYDEWLTLSPHRGGGQQRLFG